MGKYMISYDLKSPTNNREAVEEAIKSLGTWCKYLTTTFLVNTPYYKIDVQNICTKHLDSNDRMIICEISGPVTGWLSQDEWNWIRENI